MTGRRRPGRLERRLGDRARHSTSSTAPTLTTPNITYTPEFTEATVDFRIATDPQPGPGNQPPGGGNTGGDTKKAKIGMPRDADVTKRGKVRLLLTCPDDGRAATWR